MPATADADSKGCVHMECNQLLCGCAIVFHTRLVTHPDVEKPYPSGAAEQSLDGLVTAAEAISQKPEDLTGSCYMQCIVLMSVY